MNLRRIRHTATTALDPDRKPSAVPPAPRPVRQDPPPRMYSLLLPRGFTGRW